MPDFDKKMVTHGKIAYAMVCLFLMTLTQTIGTFNLLFRHSTA